ncbi:MAG: phospho-sugar mutase [Nanoarchaeota archaeon]
MVQDNTLDSKSQNIDEYYNKCKEGINSLDIAQKYKDAALKNIKVWLSEDEFSEYVPQLKYLIDSGKFDFLLDSFYQIIPFGTGGRRGLVGIGTNRINKWTIQASAQGHSQYLVKQHGDKAKEKGVVLTYDVREFTDKGVYDDSIYNPVMNLSCKDLAEAAAQVYTANKIKVFMFDDFRSTPQLSFSIRYLDAISGDMFSASHNPPSDNGKKVYDEFGGQLVPPYDEALVKEVTQNVDDIKTIDLDEARKKGLVIDCDEKVDKAYFDAVKNLSMSESRSIKIVYSPLHGTGLRSFYPILKDMGFDISLEPKTKNISGKFENVVFNIPNPEVEQSFETLKVYGDEVNADILISSDPDADRIGVMVKHIGNWEYLNGNEIGILLSEYGIDKFKKNKKDSGNVIVKTIVTTSMIQKICEENGVECIGDLLVGFKYIGEKMNELEKQGRIDNFILGTEESHGFLMGNYARDKDGAAGAV